MPAASATTGRSRTSGARSGSQGGRTGSGAARPAPRVRWDHLGRAALLCVAVALVYLYLSAGLHMLSTWRQSRRDSATVATLTLEHKQLLREREGLNRQASLEEEARQLGMMKKDEQPYIVNGLPDN
jgi:cell division protein FtsB